MFSPLGQKIALLPVVRLRLAFRQCVPGGGGPCGQSAGAALIAAVPLQNILAGFAAGGDENLAVAAVQLLVEQAQKRRLVQILVIGLVVPDALGLEGQTALQLHRADAQLCPDRRGCGLGEHRLIEIGQGQGQVGF